MIGLRKLPPPLLNWNQLTSPRESSSSSSSWQPPPKSSYKLRFPYSCAPSLSIPIPHTHIVGQRRTTLMVRTSLELAAISGLIVWSQAGSQINRSQTLYNYHEFWTDYAQASDANSSHQVLCIYIIAVFSKIIIGIKIIAIVAPIRRCIQFKLHTCIRTHYCDVHRLIRN